MELQYNAMIATDIQKAGRKQVLIIILASSLTIMGSVMIAAMIPKMALEFANKTPNFNFLLAIVIAGPALTIALFSPFVGWIIDRFGRKVILILATLFYCLFGALPALLSDFTYIAISRLIFGLTEAMIMVACSTLIADYWKENQRSKLVNFQVIAIGIVGAVFFTLGGMLGEQGWRIPFYLYLLPLLLIPFMIRFLWEPVRIKHDLTIEEIDHIQTKTQIRTLVSNDLLIIFCMILAFIMPIQAPILLSQMGVQSTTLMGLSAGLGLLSSLVGSILWTPLRINFNFLGTNAILMILAALGLYLLIHADDYKHVLVAVFFHGVAVGLMVPNMMLPVMNAVNRKHRGKALGLFTSCLYFGQFLSPILITILMKNYGDLKQSIALLIYLTLPIILIYLIQAIIHSQKLIRLIR